MVRRSDTTENGIQYGNITLLPDVDPANGDGSLEIYNTVYSDNIFSNTLSGTGVNIENTKFNDKTYTMQESSVPTQPIANETIFYIDTADALLKSKDNSDVITTYQPTNTKGDIIVHNGTTQVRLPVGLNDQILTVSTVETTGIKWAAVTDIRRIQLSVTALPFNQSVQVVELPYGGYISLISPLIYGGSSGNFIFSKSQPDTIGHSIRLNGNPSLVDSELIYPVYPSYIGATLINNAVNVDSPYTNLETSLFIHNDFTLSGTSWTEFSSNITGIFFITISPSTTNGPVATFIICKSNSGSSTAAISRLSMSPGRSPITYLEIQWSANVGIQFRKNTSSYDDIYEIKDNFQYSEKTITIALSGTSPSFISKSVFPYYTQKSFYVGVIGIPTNSPCAIFTVSKNINNLNSNIVKINAKGTSTTTSLALQWNSNSLISISKSDSSYDGNYTVILSRIN